MTKDRHFLIIYCHIYTFAQLPFSCVQMATATKVPEVRDITRVERTGKQTIELDFHRLGLFTADL